MSLDIPFDNSYAALPEGFFARLNPTPVKAPELIVYNHILADALGIGAAPDAELAEVFSGNHVPENASVLAQLYAGHQFGQFNPQLGDGRALLLGEVIDRSGTRRDVQLKGSGPTPFSRMGDGRAWLGPVLREYIVSEAMHALGVPTTRALAAVRSGEIVLRDSGPLPGAVLTRVASSHIRVGTFQVFAARRDYDRLQKLLDYTLERHAPKADGPEGLLRDVVSRQAELVAHWMSLGFIHGVMNTDNCAISGETIDYGPCAFLDGYDPDKVFSSIDRHGRYAYAAQADVIVWNMAQLATALVPLMPDADTAITRFTEIIHAMPDQIRAAWRCRFAAKIGISQPRDGDDALIGRFLTLMQAEGADFTQSFRALAEGRGVPGLQDQPGLADWARDWESRLTSEPQAEETMRAANPVYIPRNHMVERVIARAVEGDDTLLHQMLKVGQTPFEAQDGAEAFASPPPPEEEVRATFCGT